MKNTIDSTFRFLFSFMRLHLNEKELLFFSEQVLKIKDWNYVLLKAKHHNVGNVLYKNLLLVSDKSSIPNEVLEKLKRMYLKTVFKNTTRYAELKQISTKLAAATIEFSLLKGIFISKWLYNDIGLRPMGDMDILVNETDIEKTKNIFLENGWSLMNKENMYKSAVTVYVDAAITHQPYSFVKGALILELHKNICTKLVNDSLVISEFLTRAKTYSIFNQNFRSFSINDTLIHLCIHAYSDSLGHGIKLKNTMDIAELLKQHRDIIDWKELYNNCKKYNCYTEVKCSLLICHTYLDAPINDIFAVADFKYIMYENIFLNSLNNGKIYKTVRAVKTYKNKLHKIGMANSMYDKVKMMMAELLPSRMFVNYQYHSKKKYRFHFQLYKLIYTTKNATG